MRNGPLSIGQLKTPEFDQIVGPSRAKGSVQKGQNKATFRRVIDETYQKKLAIEELFSPNIGTSS